MMHLLQRLFLTLVITIGFSTIHAQQDQPPLDAQLLKNSEKWLIKIGMISGKKPPKLKFGEFSTVDRSGATGEDFSMTMINSANDSVFVKGINEKGSGKNQNDISVYINTSIDSEELWILMMTRPPLSKKTQEERREISLESIIMTDGFSEVTFEKIMAEPKGDIEETAAKAVQVLSDGMPIAAIQYDSGATFSYKKYIWISKRMDPQTQLMAAAAFSALLEIGEYFSDIVIVD